MSWFLNTTWIPVFTWLFDNIFPSPFLFFIVLFFTLRRTRNFSCFSFLHGSPVSLRKNKSGYRTRSLYLIFINIFIMFLLSMYLVILALDIENQPFIRSLRAKQASFNWILQGTYRSLLEDKWSKINIYDHFAIFARIPFYINLLIYSWYHITFQCSTKYASD